MQYEKGFTLIETLLAVAIIGIIAVGIFSGLGMATKVLMNTDGEETARDLAVAEMEYIKQLPFQPGVATYLTPGGIPNTVTYPDANIHKQLVTVSVDYQIHRAGEVISRIFRLEDYKVNREFWVSQDDE